MPSSTLPKTVPFAGARFDNSYARLPDRFYSRQSPAKAAKPQLLCLNAALAKKLGLSPAALASPEGINIFAGNQAPAGAAPLSMAYAGHQFGHFVPQLGDGRAVLLGEVIGADGARRDIQLKGAGRTAYSRGGDGRAPIGPVLREYIISEAMHALGIPTTRSLAAVATGEPVYREETLPGGVLTRVAQSHIRVGTFQYFAVREDTLAVAMLADHVIARHYRDIENAEHPYRALLERVVHVQADLVARWMQVGFIHGVMNTDNCAISGETLDYGPCAFMDTFHPATVYSYIDRNGRYAFGNQPKIAHWNLGQFAKTLLPLLANTEDEAKEVAEQVVNGFRAIFAQKWLAGMTRKLGLEDVRDEDRALVDELLIAMREDHADFTLTFRLLADAAEAPQAPQAGLAAVRRLFAAPEAFDVWAVRWQARLALEPRAPEKIAEQMRACNPAYIPRNHMVNAALDAATAGDLGPVTALLEVLATPFKVQKNREIYAAPPAPGEEITQTFCGT